MLSCCEPVPVGEADETVHLGVSGAPVALELARVGIDLGRAMLSPLISLPPHQFYEPEHHVVSLTCPGASSGNKGESAINPGRAIKGQKGEPGRDGTRGVPGLPGSVGFAGEKGDRGERGPSVSDCWPRKPAPGLSAAG